jgi:uncharacterized glyoxalase superfamily protein PhnB
MPSDVSLDHQPVVYPVLFYRDAAAALDWLVRVFGFTRRMAATAPDGSISHAELSLDSGVIMLASVNAERGWQSPVTLGAVNQSVCVHVADPDAHHARATAAGAEILLPLMTKDYGARDYTCRDLEGHVWTFGTYRPGGYWEK